MLKECNLFEINLIDNICYLFRAYRDYENEDYVKAGLDLVKAFIKSFNTMNSNTYSGPPPDFKAMGGAISLDVSFSLRKVFISYPKAFIFFLYIQCQINRLNIKVSEMNFLVNNLRKTILQFDNHNLSPEILSLPGIQDLFTNKTAAEKDELMRRYNTILCQTET